MTPVSAGEAVVDDRKPVHRTPIRSEGLLREISRELVTRLMEAVPAQKIQVTVKDGNFAYDYA